MMIAINLFLLFGTVLVTVESSSDTGPIGPVTVYDIQNCDPQLDKLNAQHKLQQDIDHKDKVTLSLSVPFDIGPDATVSLDADKFDGSDWQKNAFSIDSKPLFKFLNDFVPAIWNNLREEIEPKIQYVSNIPAGDYNLNKFYANYMDINTPQVPYGRFMASIYITANDEDLICRKIEIEFSPPLGPK